MRLVTVHEDNRLCVTTRCKSVTQFVAEFKRYVEDDTLFVATRVTHAKGVELPFVVALADGTPVMSGTASVREVWETGANPFELPGILLGIERLTGEGWEVLRNMQRHRAETLVSLAPPPPHDRDSESAAFDEVADGVPQFLDTEQTSRGRSEPALLPVKHPTLVMASAPPPPPPSPSRKYVCPVPRLLTPVPGEQAGMDDDLFSLPTRVSTPLPRTLLLGAGLNHQKRSDRPYWLWAGATALALLASVGVVRATGADPAASQGVATRAPEPMVVRRETTWPIVGEGGCRLSVLAVPAGSTVDLDGAPQGLSPLTLATTCGQHRIDVSHPTHATLSVLGTLVEGQPETIDVTLARRIDAVWVVSRPVGAMVYIDGHPIGRTPKRLDVLGHVPLTLEIRKRGYQPVVEHVYSTTPRNRLAVQLTPERQPPGQKAGRTTPGASATETAGTSRARPQAPPRSTRDQLHRR